MISSRSLRSLGSLLSGRPLGGGALLALAFGLALTSPSCASIGEPAAWADGEVRELDSGRPIQGALVFMGASAPGQAGSSCADRTNEAGHFAVLQTVDRRQRTIPLVVDAKGFKRAELPLRTRQSNSLIVRLAAAGSSKASRIEQMPAQSDDGDGMDGSCGSR